jgi:ABC-type dipeptide/oligopeptide/nickel transport system permease component
MLTYLTRRLIQGLIVLLAVSFVCFVIFRYMGDPVVSMAGQFATAAEREEIRKLFGLDQPPYVQYWRFLTNALQGNFGISYETRLPALGLIVERIPATVELAISAMVFAFTVGVGLGILVSVNPRAWLSRAIMAGSLGGISIPTFLIGIVLIMVFAVELSIMPPFGRGEIVPLNGWWSTNFLTPDGIRHLILPAFTLGMYQLAVLLRLTRSGMREVLTTEYIKTAWAKGLSPARVVLKHALRNVLIPVITVAGLQFGELIAFSLVTETIFQWPGLGNLLLQALYEADQPIIVTYISLVAVLILTINIVVDVLYALLNPKIRYE